jgi:hypothetical protein
MINLHAQWTCSLDIPPPSEAITKEKEFIEATSRITAFNVMSRPGIPISPIEIRLTKDRLTLVSRVLSSTPDAYKHADLILDLAYKLGFRGDPVAETKVLAMVADTALQAEDFAPADEAAARMVAGVLALRGSGSAGAGAEDPRVQEASEVCWVACFQLGRQGEFADAPKKAALLGRALELCPAEKLPDVLGAWRKLEAERGEERRARRAERRGHGRGRSVRPTRKSALDAMPISAAAAASAAASAAATSLASRLQGFHMSDLPSLPGSPFVNAPDAAALANKALGRVAANFPFGRRDRSVDSARTSGSGRSESRDISRTRTPDVAQVADQATRVFQKGMGWLIGSE